MSKDRRLLIAACVCYHSFDMTKRKLKIDFSTGGIVWDGAKRKILLIYVQNLTGKRVWTFPKGHPEEGENDEEAALREVREETGWECEILKKLMDVHYAYTHKSEFVKKTVRWFLMKPVKKTGDSDPEEIIRCSWLSPEAAAQKVVYKTDQNLLSELEKMEL